ncbi:C40 family peptidase [Stenotrophomonas sp. GD03680]|nr:NlpC/P60 family protein [Stenotrophomonas sp. GD03680]MDH2022956.1 C40 family peptidase [Stenotrophomonas sp. GD03680]
MRRWVGIPYQGEKFCREFVRQVMAEHGIPMPVVDAPEDARGWVRVEVPERLDVVVFNNAGRPWHVGVCLGSGDFLHVEEGMTSRVERLGSPLWEARISGFYRYVGGYG